MSRTFFLLLLCANMAYAQPDWVTTDIAEVLTMKVPTKLTARNPTMQRSTAPTLGLFMTDDFRAELAVSKASLQWSAEDVQLLSQFYKAGILNLYDKVDMLQEGMKELDGKPTIYFEFVGQIVDEPNAFAESRKQSDYVYIQYVIADGGVYVVRFSCPAAQRSTWQAVVGESMESVQFKKKKRKR